MGNGIAHVFAQNNYKVHLIDISQEAIEKGLTTISNNLDRLLAKERITESVKSQTLANILTFTSISEGVKNCDLIVEAATENVDLKLKIFKELDKEAPKNAILAIIFSQKFVFYLCLLVLGDARGQIS